jgi:DNA-3-methyladenine glycosylase II
MAPTMPSMAHDGPVPGFTVDLRGPLDLAASLEPFRRSGDDLIDRWNGQRLLRTARIAGRTMAYRAEISGTLEAPSLTITIERATRSPGPAGYERAMGQAIRGTFVATPPDWTALLAADPVLAALDRQHTGLRPVLQPDLLTALVRSISAQQVNLTWAATTRRRLAEAFGDRHVVDGEDVYSLSSERLAEAPAEALRELQFTTAKSRSIVEVATAVAEGRLDGEALATRPDEDVIAALVSLRGIGVWTAEWILARTFGRPRVVAGDLGVRKAVGRVYLGIPIASEDEVRQATDHWGDGAGVAQALLLRTLVP